MASYSRDTKDLLATGPDRAEVCLDLLNDERGRLM